MTFAETLSGTPAVNVFVGVPALPPLGNVVTVSDTVAMAGVVAVGVPDPEEEGLLVEALPPPQPVRASASDIRETAITL